jgi:endonuclease/exonuclease/phosphatase family metal-dependent hydrolase
MPRRFSGVWFTYPRATATARLVLRGRPVSVSSVHLDVWEPGRLAHVDRILRGMDDDASAVAHVVAGDLNEGPDGAAWQRLTARLTDAAHDGGPTYPATATRRPRSRLDAVLLGGPVTAVRHRTGPDRTGLPSDHLPVLVELEMRDPSDPADEREAPVTPAAAASSAAWLERWGAPPGGA